MLRVEVANVKGAAVHISLGYMCMAMAIYSWLPCPTVHMRSRRLSSCALRMSTEGVLEGKSHIMQFTYRFDISTEIFHYGGEIKKKVGLVQWFFPSQRAGVGNGIIVSRIQCFFPSRKCSTCRC